MGTKFPLLSWALIVLYGVPAIGGFFAVLTLYNPLISHHSTPNGPYLLGTLFVTYAIPGLIFLALAAKAKWLRWPGFLRWGGITFLTMYAILEIRSYWHARRVDIIEGFTQEELYTYTIALLILGGVLLYQAIARKSNGLRRLAMGVIAAAIVKVFFVDVTGLTGLLRVFSFLALGLVLAGLAWLNRWAAQQAPKETPKD